MIAIIMMTIVIIIGLSIGYMFGNTEKPQKNNKR